MGRYWLADHVFVCVNDEHVVLLDVKQDRYWALPAASTAPLGELLPGWPVKPSQSPAAEPTDPQEAEEVAAALKEEGILADCGASGKDATPVAVPAPTQELLSADGYLAASVTARAVRNVIAAAISAKVALRFGRFEKAVDRFRERKRRAGGRTHSLDVARARQLVEQFLRVRVFLFSSSSECLFDSLALLNFLARYGIHADWIFGVQARPFAAHCWVQLDDIVFNDTIEHVSGYTPIMAI